MSCHTHLIGSRCPWVFTSSHLHAWASLLDLTFLPFYFDLTFSVFFHSSVLMHPEPHTDLDNLNTVQPNLRHSAKGSNDDYDVTDSLTGTVLGIILFRLTENPTLTDEISENTLNEELNKQILDSELYSIEYKMEIQNLERRSSQYALFESQRELEFQRRQLLKANQWADQAQRRRIHLCSRLGMKDHLHKECCARSCRESEELKRCCYQEGNCSKQRSLEEFPTQHDQESRTGSLLSDQRRRLQERLESIEDSKSSTILTCWAVMTDLRSSSSSCYLEFKKALPRSWNAAKYNRKNELGYISDESNYSNSSISAIGISASQIPPANKACLRRILQIFVHFEISLLPWGLGHLAVSNGIP